MKAVPCTDYSTAIMQSVACGMCGALFQRSRGIERRKDGANSVPVINLDQRHVMPVASLVIRKPLDSAASAVIEYSMSGCPA